MFLFLCNFFLNYGTNCFRVVYVVIMKTSWMRLNLIKGLAWTYFFMVNPAYKSFDEIFVNSTILSDYLVSLFSHNKWQK